MNRIRRITATAAAALLALSLTGAARAEIKAETREERGRVMQVVWKDENGIPAPGPEGYAEVRYDYAYQQVTERYYDGEGNPFETAGGYYGKTVIRDSRNFITSVEYLGVNGKLTMTRMGYAMISYPSYFTFGAERVVVFCGTNRRPVMVPSLGYAQVENEYKGTTLTGRTYKDEKGNPVDIPAGYAMMKKKMSKTSKILRVWYTHADGTPATGPDGWYMCVYERDSKDRVTAVRYLDETEQPTEKGGCAWEEYVYNRDGTVTLTRFGLQGNRIPFENGAVSVRRTIKKDRITTETYLGENGEETATISYKYDQDGNLIEVIR